MRFHDDSAATDGIALPPVPRQAARTLERDAEAHAPRPHHAAFLLRAGVQQFKPLRQRPGRTDLETRAAGGIIQDAAIDHRRFRIDNDLAGPGHASRRPDAGKAAILMHATIQIDGSEFCENLHLQKDALSKRCGPVTTTLAAIA